MAVRAVLTAFALMVGPATAAAEVPVQSYEVVARHPHDRTAFTEGLFYRDGLIYESTGRFPSDIRIWRLSDGEVLKKRELDKAFFGEGIVGVGDKIVSLTWRNHIGFIWNAADLSPAGAFTYPGEGWALTRDDTRIIMSDGTPALRFLDPQTLAETGRITVTADGRPVDQLNELEWVDLGDGPEILANVWQTDRIARIDPATGNVKAWIDLTGLFPLEPGMDPLDDVLNGIAWDRESNRLFVTGKDWPTLFEIRIKE